MLVYKNVGGEGDRLEIGCHVQWVYFLLLDLILKKIQTQ